jgi:hypothetical protein
VSRKKGEKFVRSPAAKLEPKFTCVTRIIDTREVDENDIAEIQKIQNMLADYDMSRAIRGGAEKGKTMMQTEGNNVLYGG